MGIIKSIINEYQSNKEEMNKNCELLIINIETFCKHTESIFEKLEFIDNSKELKIQDEYQPLLNSLSNDKLRKLKRAKKYKDLLLKKDKLNNSINELSKDIQIHNEKVADTLINYAYTLIGNVEGRRLDKQQMNCIVKDVDNHLVVAGAGTGKTTTIVGKIKYLLKKNYCTYKDILVLSFTNASATEMKERVQKETGFDIDAMTFHKLGMEILTKVEGISPRISHVDIRQYVRNQIEDNIKNEKYLKLLNKFIYNTRVKVRNEFDFKDFKEYKEWLRSNPPTTLKKEIVKSYGEMIIANFLYSNGIEYQYEASYCLDTRTEEYGQYHPDFFLPQYNIYIEYFGVNRDNEPPEYFNDREEYVKSMNWKKELHNKNDTILIDCYAYENMEGILTNVLKEKLKNANVIFYPKSPKEMLEILTKENDNILNGLIDLIVTIINLIKSNDYTFDKVIELNENSGLKDKSNNKMLLALISPIFHSYNKMLFDNNEIDFNDMINKSRKYIEDKKYIHSYKYIIVDEYQDISKARFRLLKCMRDCNNFKLFCVGDDWQSIYRFTGSDIDYIVNFSKYWGPSQRSNIETTYRFNQSLIDISSKFVMKNPMQLQKSIKSKLKNQFALAEINGYTEQIAIENMIKRLDELPQNSSVFILGRYNYDIHILDETPVLSYKFDNIKKQVVVEYRKRLDLKMVFLTAHTSKGLQADYAFIINNKNNRMGFPSKIEDNSIIDLLLEDKDHYPYSEERRLFYVALTRAKIKNHLIVVKGLESTFINEIKKEYAKELKNEFFTCPLCGGRLIKKSGRFGDFFGCSNYKENGCKYTRKI